MPIPIRDLDIDETGIACTLSFNRSPFHCVMPWTSIFALVGEDGRGMVWPDDVPPEVAQQTTPKTGRDGKRTPAARPVRAEAPRGKRPRAEEKMEKEDVRTKLAIVPEGQEAGAAPAETRAPEREESPPPRKPKRELPPYLRVVK
jgi:hypothetical protein